MDAIPDIDLSENEEQRSSASIGVAYHELKIYRATYSICLLLQLLLELFNDKVDRDYFVNALFPKLDLLQQLTSGHISTFKTVTGLYPGEFECLSERSCPILFCRSRYSGQILMTTGRPTKLNPQERLLSVILYLRHNYSVRYGSSSWNYSRSSLHEDALFICEIITVVMAREAKWLNIVRRAQLRTRISQVPGCVGFVDGTLCRIRQPNCSDHRAYFRRCKKMYCFNTCVVVDHDGLFIYVSAGYVGSFHDARVLKETPLGSNWQQYFTFDLNSPSPLEFVLGDPGYMEMDQFVPSRLDAIEFSDVDAHSVLQAFNKMHAGFCVAVEWGIGGLKCKFKKFLETCLNRRDTFELIFSTAAILTNFMHRRKKDYATSMEGGTNGESGE
ncbi:hypothetical protein BWQ96_09956 [Gracilariopsis chorda]|uniref:DDE Tnp4 domain-containing protein n=1 Tax=Gracilariopsis chorda TaxID=448386 RepID=A0A2V3IE22_9FLOR|nr:hypothetical protein BWQ96_09956 [Gracilariopsis chorda]|eukprot:PXF40335.1 hypothetical protein BWQ96_09956 [Gracilariopsis chorda]